MMIQVQQVQSYGGMDYDVDVTGAISRKVIFVAKLQQ
jgi:hypothetical protein